MTDDEIDWSQLGDDAASAAAEVERLAALELERSDWDARAAAIAENLRRSRAMVDAQRHSSLRRP